MDDHEICTDTTTDGMSKNGGLEIGPNGGLKRVHLDTPTKGASEGTHGVIHLRVIHVYMV